MPRITCCATVLLLLLTSFARADGLQVFVEPPGGAISPNVPFDVTLRLLNDSAENSLVFFWQAALAFEPDSGAQGSLEIAGIDGSDQRLMTGLSPFGPQLYVPEGGWPTASEGDFTFTGAPLGPGESAELATLHIVPSPDASGMFHLQLAPADFFGLDGSSYWFDEAGPDPLPFGNDNPVSGYVGQRLATYQVVPEPQMAMAIFLLGGLFCRSTLCRRSI